MHIKSIVAGATIALIAGVGSVSADELHVTDTTVTTGAPFALLNGIPTEQMTFQELGATRGATAKIAFATGGTVSFGAVTDDGSTIVSDPGAVGGIIVSGPALLVLDPQKTTNVSLAAGPCWVAREVYGADNPKWLLFREWVTTRAPKWLLASYLKYGERMASWLRGKERSKAIIRKWMDARILGMSRS